MHSYFAQKYYTSASRATLSDKHIEIRVFSDVTNAMKREAATAGGALTPEFADSISRNNTLWKTLMLDLLSPENALPQSLKLSLIELAEFSMAHGHRVLMGEANASVLVDINMAILGGLKASLRVVSSPDLVEAV